MIGRGVFLNPYCFTDYQPTRDDLIGLLKYHLELFAQYETKHKVSYEPMKHFFKIYVNNFPGASEIRAKLMETHDVRSAKDILRAYDL